MKEGAFAVVAEGEYVTQKRKEKKNMSVDPNNTFWKEDKSKFGLKMLQKMGWTEGKGLGKNESGMTEFVKTEVRKENQGLGSDIDTSKNWFETRDAYNNMLATLNAKYNNNASSDSSDESSSEDEKPTTTSPTSRPRHLISATKRHKAKMVSNYSKADIAAILGKHPADLEESSPKTIKKEKRKPAKEEIAEEDAETDKKKKKKEKKQKDVAPDQEESIVEQPVDETTDKKKKKKKKHQPDQDVVVETTEEAPAPKKRKEKHTPVVESEKENKKASKKPKNV